MFFNVMMWGVVVSCTAAANDFKSLLATRFFLGIFEATVGKSEKLSLITLLTTLAAPCFITITQMVCSYHMGYIDMFIRL